MCPVLRFSDNSPTTPTTDGVNVHGLDTTTTSDDAERRIIPATVYRRMQQAAEEINMSAIRNLSFSGLNASRSGDLNETDYDPATSSSSSPSSPTSRSSSGFVSTVISWLINAIRVMVTLPFMIVYTAASYVLLTDVFLLQVGGRGARWLGVVARYLWTHARMLLLGVLLGMLLWGLLAGPERVLVPGSGNGTCTPEEIQATFNKFIKCV